MSREKYTSIIQIKKNKKTKNKSEFNSVPANNYLFKVNKKNPGKGVKYVQS